MKKVFYLYIFVFMFIIGTNVVLADDSYDIYIDASNNMVVKNSLDNSVISDTSNIVEYSNSLLTLKEGIYYDYIEINHDITITTNNKKVFIEDFKMQGSSTKPLKVIFDKANIKAYYDGVNSHGYRQFYLYYVYGEYKNSNFDLYYTDDDSIQLWNGYIKSDKGCKFDNFSIKTGTFYLDAANNTFNNSEFYVKEFNLYDEGNNITFDNVLIEYYSKFYISGGFDSAYDYYTRIITFNDTDIICKEKSGITYSLIDIMGKTTFNNCTLTSLHGKVSVNGDATYNNCVIDSYRSVTGFHLSIIDSDVKAGDEIDGSYTLYIKNSTIKQDVTHAYYPYICATYDISIIDSYVDSNGSIYNLMEDNTILIENSKVITRSISAAGKVKLKDSVVYIDNTGEFYGSDPYAAISSKGTLSVINTRLIAETSGSIPAIISLTGFVFENENGTFISKEKQRLSVTKYNASENNVLPNNTVSFINLEKVRIDKDQEIYTTTLNDLPTKYAETYGYYNVKVKIVNGTIDGETEKEYNLLLDEEFTYPTNMKANKGYEGGSWVSTGENEYTYTFNKIPNNPPTGVKDYILLLVLSIGALVLFIKNKNKTTMFKRI